MDTSPEVLTLENGKIGYFYSLAQLEEMRRRKMIIERDDQVAARYGYGKGNCLNGAI